MNTRGSGARIATPAVAVARLTPLALALLLAIGADQAAEPARPNDESAPERARPTLLESGVREEIVVTPSRRSPAASPRPIELDPDDRARAASPRLDDTLRQVATLDLFRRSSSRVAHPTTRGVTLRGIGPSGASRALVLLDGIPLNDPFGGWVHWGRVPSTALERVAVAPGGASDTWGSAALAGVVSLASHDPETRRRAAAIAAGERGERRAAFAAGGPIGRAALSVDAERIVSDGHRIVRDDRRGPIDVPAGSETSSLLARLAAQTARGGRIALDASLFDERRGGGTPGTWSRADGVRLATSYSGLAAAGRWDVTVHGESRDFSTRFTAQAPDRETESPALDQFDVPADAFGASAQWSGRRAGDAGWRAGIDALAVDAETNEDFRFSASPAGGRFTRRRQAGGRSLLAGAWASWASSSARRWRLEASARSDVWRSSGGRRVETSLEDGTTLLSLEYPDRTGHAFSPRIGASIRLSGSLRLTGAAYGAFRAPTINELYRPFRVRGDVTEANAFLDPERLTGLDASLELRTARLSFRAGPFASRVDDVIANATIGPGPGTVGPCAFVPAGGVCRQRTNLGRAEFLGFEADARAGLGRGWSLAAGLLAVDASLADVPGRPELSGLRPPHVPAVRVTAGAEWHRPGSLSVAFSWRAESARYEDEAQTLRLPGFGLLDVVVAREIRPGLRVTLAAGNVLDHEVETGRTSDGIVSVGAPRIVTVSVSLHGPRD